jgi:hypothetical protein
MDHHRCSSRRKKEWGDGAIMSPFAGPDETSRLNPELRARDPGTEGAIMPRVVGPVLSCLESISSRRAFAHGKTMLRSSLFVRETLLLFRCSCKVKGEGEGDGGMGRGGGRGGGRVRVRWVAGCDDGERTEERNSSAWPACRLAGEQHQARINHQPNIPHPAPAPHQHPAPRIPASRGSDTHTSG